MTGVRVLLARLKGVLKGPRSDAALEEDIQAHLELLAHDYMRSGLSPEDARAAARRAFGGVAQMKESYRDQRGVPTLDAFLQDLRYAGRMLKRDPGFTLVAALSLGLGIGAATAGFSVFNAVLLRPLAVMDPQRLVLLEPQRKGQRDIIFNPEFEELRQRQHTLSGVFAANDQPFLKVTLDGESTPTYVRGSLVSGSYFSVLGVSPALGRLLTDADDTMPASAGDAPCAAVISHSFWARRLQQDRNAVGRTLRVKETVCAIVGVAPEAFQSHQAGYAPDVWLPLRRLTDRKLLESRHMAFFGGVMGRLAPGVTIDRADAELSTIYQQIVAAHLDEQEGPAVPPEAFRMRVAPGAQGFDSVRRQFGGALVIVLAVVAVVLLIASANVANLLLARGAARLPELATRAVLGASRGRLVRQLATEAALLSVIGAACGGCLAWVGAPVLGSLVSTIQVSADARVTAVAIAATLLTILLAGLVPALRLSKSSLQADLAREGRSTLGSSTWLMRGLVAVQLALSLLLVTGASLLLRTLLHISGIDPGFRQDHVVMLDVRDETPGSSFGQIDDDEVKARRAALYERLDQRLNALPGVESASVSWLGLFSMNDLGLNLLDPDRPDVHSYAHVDYVSARYFETMGMTILRGRGFTDRDRQGTARVAVVNEALAHARFGDVGPLGKRLALDYRGEQDRPFTIVGVVRNAKYNDLREAQTRPMMWVPIAQAPFRLSSIALRVAPGTEAAIVRQAEDVLKATDGNLMVRRATTLSAQVEGTTVRERLLLRLSAGFGVLALLLAVVGVYGTLAYGVSRRTREIGVRMAFGAHRGAVLRMVLRDALMLAAAGLAIGVPLAIAAGYLLRTFLFGVTPTDPPAIASACAVMTVAALLAAYVPARRAAAVDPMTALRWE